MTTAMERVFARLKNVRRNGVGWMATCPAHDDSTPSLSVAEGHGGRAILKCHAGCETNAVVAAAGMELRDLFDDTALGENGARGRIVAEYPYHDETGAHVFDVLRLNPKGFRQRAASGVWTMKGVRRVPYRLPQLIVGVKSERTIFVVEGEKDADALVGLGLVATTNPGGAGKWKRDYNEHLRRAHVIILPDNDDAGRTHAQNVARHLIPVAQDVRIVSLPGLEPKGDVSDWLSAGGTEATLLKLVKETPALAELPVAPVTENASVRSTARALRAWLEDPALLLAPTTIIPRLAVEGRVSLLSGREKIGKSTLAACVVAAASRGEAVLGVPLVKPVQTLWYALDEPVADAVRRFKALGADLDNIIINDAPRTASELFAALDVDLAAFPDIGVVVVDTLSRVLAVSGVDTNASGEVEPVIARLSDLFHRVNVSAILLYHTGKAGREYRGSTAIGAAVDEILTLRRRGQSSDEDDFEDDGKDDGRRLLVADGRNLRGRVQLTCADGVYRLYDDAVPCRARVLDALRRYGTFKTRTGLAKKAGGRKTDTLEAIADLIGEGIISETARCLSLAAPVPAMAEHRELEPPREPMARALEFPSSREFPERGTVPEPDREPEATPVESPSSRFGRPTLQKREPASETMREIERGGVMVRQRLRPTAHGDKWIDEPPTAIL